MTTPVNGALGPLGHGVGCPVTFCDTQYDGGTMEQFFILVPCVITEIDSETGAAKLKAFTDTNLNPITSYPYSETTETGCWTPVAIPAP